MSEIGCSNERTQAERLYDVGLRAACGEPGTLVGQMVIGGLAMAFRQIMCMLEAWGDRVRQRRELLTLDARMLRDIGVTQCEVFEEARKPFWRP